MSSSLTPRTTRTTVSGARSLPGRGWYSAAIIVHDSNPPTQWHQRSGAEYAPGSEWNGTAWKAILRFRLAHPVA